MLVSLLVPQILAAAVIGAVVPNDSLSSYPSIISAPASSVAGAPSFRYATISGRVLDSNQSPVANALLSIDMIAGGRVNSAWVTTGADGRFVAGRLLPGMQYVIEASRDGYRKSVSMPLLAGDTAQTIVLVLQAETPQRADSNRLARSPQK